MDNKNLYNDDKKEKEKSEFEVTVIVVTYQPDWCKLKMTVHSVLYQEDVKMQIVIADDGSDNNHFNELRILFDNVGFTDFILLDSNKNNGTVKNFINGLSVSKGRYVNSLSPGDCLYEKDTLKKWINFMNDKRCICSGSDAIYYHFNIYGEIQALRHKAHPQLTKLSGKKLRYAYLIYDDIFVGACIMGQKEYLIKYVGMIVNKIKYAEDNLVRLMAANGENIAFYNCVTTLYEYGTGISTNGQDKWKNIIREEYKIADNMILELLERNKFQNKISKKFSKVSNARGQGFVVIPMLPIDVLIFKCIKKFHPRYTKSNLSDKLLSCLKDFHYTCSNPNDYK